MYAAVGIILGVLTLSLAILLIACYRSGNSQARRRRRQGPPVLPVGADDEDDDWARVSFTRVRARDDVDRKQRCWSVDGGASGHSGAAAGSSSSHVYMNYPLPETPPPMYTRTHPMVVGGGLGVPMSKYWVSFPEEYSNLTARPFCFQFAPIACPP